MRFVANLIKSLVVHRGMLFALADQVVVSGTRFATSWLIARFCGVEQLGLYALAFTIFVLVELLHQAFVAAPYTVGAQRWTERRLASYTGAAAVQAGVLGLLGTLIFLFCGFVLSLASRPEMARVMYAVSVYVVFLVMKEFGRRQCFATGRVGVAFCFDVACSIVQLGGMIALLKIESLDGATAYTCIGIGSALALLIWALTVTDRFQIEVRAWRLHLARHWDFGRWVFVTQASNQLGWNITQWALAIWLSAEANGVYAGCLTVVFLSNPLVLGIANILYPRLAREYAQSGQAAMNRMALKAVGFMSIAMLTFSSVLFFAGQWICDLLYADSAYANVTTTLTSLGLAISLLAITMPIDACLWAQRRTDYSSFASVSGMSTSVVLVLLLVHQGIQWAAIGLLVGCVIEALARVFLFAKSREQASLRCAVAA